MGYIKYDSFYCKIDFFIIFSSALRINIDLRDL